MLLDDLVSKEESVSGKWRGLEISGLASDSRNVQEGFLFAALTGSKLEGSRFITDACRRGVAAVLVGLESQIPLGLGIPVIQSQNPRRSLAFMASKFYGSQPSHIVAVTGTNGKTSVSVFFRQICESVGFSAASLGTIGLVAGNHAIPLSHTMPDPIELHQHLQFLVEQGVTHVALEASSHGLAQSRMDAVRLKVAAFTNLTHDHLDYHGSFENYLAKKLRLFTELLDEEGVAVINADGAYATTFIEAVQRRGIRFITVGRRGTGLTLVRSERVGLAHVLDIKDPTGKEYRVALPLVGEFQVSNALVAAGLAISCGIDASKVFSALEILEGVPGRLEMIGETVEGTSIFVDYAHTPDALRMVLQTLRPYAKRRLILVCGAGGDRDREKRAQMGQIAGECSDIVIVTDDNPRSEDPAKIRAEILSAVPDAIEIGDRGTAITAGVKMLRSGDILVVAGKGHETGQHVGDTIIPFSDRDAVQLAIGEVKRASA